MFQQCKISIIYVCCDEIVTPVSVWFLEIQFISQ